MATRKRWEAAVVAGEARVNNLARSLRGIKAALGRGELGAADFYRKIADAGLPRRRGRWRRGEEAPPLPFRGHKRRG